MPELDTLFATTVRELNRIKFAEIVQDLNAHVEHRKSLPDNHPQKYRPRLETRTDARPSFVCNQCGDIKPCSISDSYDHWMCWLCDDCWEENDE